jgi:hypothetical protein
MPVLRRTVDLGKFNSDLPLPYALRLEDVQATMKDVYDFLFDVNTLLVGRGLKRMDDMMRPAALSGMLSDMLTASLAQHSRTLTENTYHNGHPDLIVQADTPTTRSSRERKVSRSKRHANPEAPSTRTARASSGCACSSTRSTRQPNPPSTAQRFASPRSISAT